MLHVTRGNRVPQQFRVRITLKAFSVGRKAGRTAGPLGTWQCRFLESECVGGRELARFRSVLKAQISEDPHSRLLLRLRQKPTRAAHAKRQTKPAVAASAKSNNSGCHDHNGSPIPATASDTIARTSGRARNGKRVPRRGQGNWRHGDWGSIRSGSVANSVAGSVRNGRQYF